MDSFFRKLETQAPHIVFWLCLLIALAFVNSLAGLLYIDIPEMDGGDGFISFSPTIDYVIYGGGALLFGLLAYGIANQENISAPPILPSLRFPVAYLATLVGLTLAVLLMGLFGFLNEYAPWRLSFWGYAGVIALMYLLCGAILGHRMKGSVSWGLLWGSVFTALLWKVGGWQGQLFDAKGITWATTKYSVAWAILGRVNFPACILLKHYENPGTLTLSQLTIVVCLAPPILFTLGWILASISCHLLKRKEEHDI